MTYVGAIPTTGDFKILDSITTSSATTFNLRQGGVAVYPQSSSHVLCVLNGILQTGGSSFNIVNDTIVFASSLASSDVINQILVLGNVNDIGTPSDDTITAAKLNNTAISGLSALAATPDDTDELMISDAGTLKRIDYSYLKSSVVNRPNANPIIINGNMNIWQRSTSAVTMSDGYYNVDRYRGEENTSGSATWSRSTSVPDDTGLPYSLQVDCTGTDTSISSSDKCVIQHTIEAQNIAGLVKYGTSNAEKITIAFWCKSNQTGQHSVGLRKLDNTQYCQPKTYTISSADTWEKKVLTFSALTSTGGAINQDNGDGLQIFWCLTSGSGLQGTADTWTQTNEGAIAVSGDVNFLSSTSNDFYLTGVQLEIGEYTSSTLPPFQHESFADNLHRCERYFQVVAKGVDNARIVNAYNYDGTNTEATYNYFPTMRATPSIDQDTGTGYFEFRGNNDNSAFDSFGGMDGGSGHHAVRIYGTGGGSSSAGQAGSYRLGNASASIALQSEL